MAWLGGVFNRIHNWVNDRDANIKILATRHDAEDDNLATGINDTLHKGGQNSATANLPMGTFRHTAVGNALTRTQYSSAGQIQDGNLVFSTTGGAANAQTLVLSPPITAYTAGQEFTFIAGFTNTAAMTLDINAIGDQSVRKNGTELLIANDIVATRVYTIVYDGTNFQLSAGFSTTHILDRDTVLADVVNTTSETDVYSFNIFGNTLSTDRMVRLILIGDFLNNTGGTVFIDIRVKYGTTTILTFNKGLVTNANRRPIIGRIHLSAFNSTNAQVSWIEMSLLSLSIASTGAGETSSHQRSVHNSLTEDSTTDLDLVVSYELDTADPNASARLLTAHLEFL